MLHKNIKAEGLLRVLTAVLGSDVTIRLVDGLRCPRCQAGISNNVELTDDGWRLLCRGCHTDILTVEGEVP
jgi:hypothetical protein